MEYRRQASESTIVVPRDVELRIGVFIDHENIRPWLKYNQYQIDYERLYNYFCGLGYLAAANIYIVSGRHLKSRKADGNTSQIQEHDQPENQAVKDEGSECQNTLMGFFQKLRNIGFLLRVKEAQKRQSPNGEEYTKGNCDVEIAFDIARLAPRLDAVVVVSGDGDFTYLVKELRDQGIRMIVVAPSDRISRRLCEAADQYVDFEKLGTRYFLRKDKRKFRNAQINSIIQVVEEIDVEPIFTETA